MLDDWMTNTQCRELGHIRLWLWTWSSQYPIQPQAAPAGDLHVQGVRRRPLGGYQEQLHGENLEAQSFKWSETMVELIQWSHEFAGLEITAKSSNAHLDQQNSLAGAANRWTPWWGWALFCDGFWGFILIMARIHRARQRYGCVCQLHILKTCVLR